MVWFFWLVTETLAGEWAKPLLFGMGMAWDRWDLSPWR